MMDISVTFGGGGVDWPAWVQAVGSVVAIAAAIVIDQGSARRALEAERRRAEAYKADWERCLSDVVEMVSNAVRLAERKPGHATRVDFPTRLLKNAMELIDVYLRQPPPDPRLAFALAAAKTHLEVPAALIRAYDDRAVRGETPLYDADGSEARITQSIKRCSERLNILLAGYRAGQI
ncbi:MAG: hypothetical protein K2X61_08155 [Caulobacteraceae bacterium]|nr:hypothetical protein [Caulobacteraceae bacterium]